MAVTLCPALWRTVDSAAGQPVCRREGLAPPSPTTGRVCVCVCGGGDLGSRWAWTLMFMYLHFVSLVSKVWQNIIELCQHLC